MQLLKIIFCYCYVLIVDFSNGSSIKASEIKTHIKNHVMELIDNSFTNNSNPVIITSDLIDDKAVDDQVSTKNPLIVINSDGKPRNIAGYLRSYPTYVLNFKSFKELILLMFEFMSSSVWSIKSPFFIINCIEELHDEIALNVLRVLSDFGIIVAYYLSYDSAKDSTRIYTLNPYTQYAPPPWNEVKFPYKDKKTKSTLYSLQYPKDLKKNYRNLYFDKTQHLDGHEIKLVAFLNLQDTTQQHRQEMIDKYIKRVDQLKDFTLNSLSDYLNITTSMHILENYHDIHMMQRGFNSELLLRQYDVDNRMTQLADTNFKMTDFLTEYRETSFSILTKKTDYLTVITEFNVNYHFIFITVGVLGLITVIMMINNRFHITEAVMDIARMLMGMGVLSPMDRLSMKIIYFFGFLFIFMVMPELQGQVSAILSKPARRNVETLQDLFDNKYHVYFDGVLSNDMANAKLWVSQEDLKYLHPLKSSTLLKCAVEAQTNVTIACIYNTADQLQLALKLKNLHVSKESVFKKYFVHWTKKNWALKDKIDKARSIPVEIGLMHLYTGRIIKNRWKMIKKIEKINETEKYERIEFENLVFYFILFGATLLWSFIIYGIELIVYHSYSKYQRQMEKRRQFIEWLRAQPRIIFFPGRIVLSNSRE